jgi:hypothetical protein
MWFLIPRCLTALVLIGAAVLALGAAADSRKHTPD